MVSGNYSWLNFLIITLAFFGVSGRVVQSVFDLNLASAGTAPVWFGVVSILVGLLALKLSIEPVQKYLPPISLERPKNRQKTGKTGL